MATDPSDSSSDTGDDQPGALLRFHRNTVESTRGMSTAVLLGSSFAVAMGICAWLGLRWDAKHGTEPWGVLAGVGLAFLYGGYEVWKIMRISSDVPEKDGEGKRDDPSRAESGGEGR